MPIVPGRRPLVVLAGWLGSTPRQLRKFEELYRQLGFQVVTRIATPAQVFRQCFPLDPIKVPQKWPMDPLPEPKSIEDIAWDVLRHVHHSGCDGFVIHAFSNAGCFVYEAVRNIMGLTSWPHDTFITRHQESVLLELKQRYAGGIFDSAPGKDLNGIDRAMVHCSPSDMAQVRMQGGWDWWRLHTPEVKSRIDQRSQWYHDTFRRDHWSFPQLFIYSRNDDMIPFEDIDEVVQERTGRFPEKVRAKTWDDSPHCGHFKMHHKEYQATLEVFLKECLQNQSAPQQRSRL